MIIVPRLNLGTRSNNAPAAVTLKGAAIQTCVRQSGLKNLISLLWQALFV
ncbi:hypothetical protein [Microseira wollei]|uniref:Uncharacterized protein n=1 Tax=Microseira wollei NIES-4236 TaxID=2530354 RepID=A0AAV3X7J8_9CYAN|nr:hypothetical protein [Microseira wollei]GET37333.1 hypothetical protein MiSe_20860 [Microseira wollei NIES-4236]